MPEENQMDTSDSGDSWPKVLGQVTKSPNDKLEYRVIELPNGLRCMLISDLNDLESGDDDEEENEVAEEGDDDEGRGEESGDEGSQDGDSDKPKNKTEKLSAAALCVGIGSFCDPEDIPGFAHFLEHMVFMGSKKYPNENEFDSFLKEHGGHSNAYTDTERTVFYFGVNQPHFHGALDRFAQFFINPLMLPGSVDRELQAVDSEFNMCLTSDGARKEQLLGEAAVKGHPMGKFMWGNLETLKTNIEAGGIDLYGRLQEFHQDVYSAHYMTLVVQSRTTLDELQDQVVEIFSAVSNNGKKQPEFLNAGPPFDEKKFCKLYRAVPVKDVHQVEITWVLPSLLTKYKIKAEHYLGWLVGHEGPGSILAYLRKKLWATNLAAGNENSGFEHNTTWANFSITVDLTDEGLKHVEEVICCVFEYLLMLQQAGASQRVYQEVQTVEDNDFRFQSKSDPVDYVEEVVAKMQLYSVEDYLTGDQLMFQYDAQLIEDCQKLLTPDRARILLYSATMAPHCVSSEHYFSTKYSCGEIPQEWRQQWKAIVPDKTKFHIPAENTYIASDFTLKESDRKFTEHPEVIYSDSLCKLWYKQDNKFKVPKGYVNVMLRSAFASATAGCVAMLELYMKILEHQLAEVAYAAEIAQLSYKFTYNEYGVSVVVNGFNHKLKNLLCTLLKPMANFDVSEAEFDAIKSQLSRSYYNEYINPEKLNQEMRLSVLYQKHWTVVEKRVALHQITRSMLLAYITQYYNSLFVEGLVQGNFTSQEATDLLKEVVTTLPCQSDTSPVNNKLRVVSLPEGERYVRVQNYNATDVNCTICNYYQYGVGNIRILALNDLLMMHMDEPCFDNLRTKHQLGYTVYSMARNTSGVVAISVTVCSQSDKFSMVDLNQRIEDFLLEFEQTVIDKMTQADFDTVRESLIALKRVEDPHLKREVRRNWSEITNKHYVFDRIDKEIEELAKFTIDDLKKWYKEVIQSGRKKLSIQVVGNVKQDGEKTTEVNNTSMEVSSEDTPLPQGSGTAEGNVVTPPSQSNPPTQGSSWEKHRERLGVAEALTEKSQLKYLALEENIADKVITDIDSFKRDRTLYPVTLSV